MEITLKVSLSILPYFTKQNETRTTLRKDIIRIAPEYKYHTMQNLHGVNMTPGLSVELQISLLARRYEKLDNNNANCE